MRDNCCYYNDTFVKKKNLSVLLFCLGLRVRCGIWSHYFWFLPIILLNTCLDRFSKQVTCTSKQPKYYISGGHHGCYALNDAFSKYFSRNSVWNNHLLSLNCGLCWSWRRLFTLGMRVSRRNCLSFASKDTIVPILYASIPFSDDLKMSIICCSTNTKLSVQNAFWVHQLNRISFYHSTKYPL